MDHIDKTKLIEAICKQLEKDLETVKIAALATYEAATGEESKPENEYDTRGLEASYLAGAQAQRAAEIEEQISLFRYLKPRSFDDLTPIGATALVSVEYNGKNLVLFVMPKGGGLSIQFNNEKIQVVTPASPLGEALIGLKAGDVAVIDAGHQTKEYEIIQVL